MDGKPVNIPSYHVEVGQEISLDPKLKENVGVKLALDFYGVDHVMWGDDYPCWNPEGAHKVFQACGLSEADTEKVMNSNARRILGLKEPVKAKKEAVPA